MLCATRPSSICSGDVLEEDLRVIVGRGARSHATYAREDSIHGPEQVQCLVDEMGAEVIEQPG